jgi:hypothetical protein
MDDAERLALGREAEALINNQAFKAAIDSLRDRYLAEFPKTAEGDVSAWKLLHAKLQVLRGFEAELSAMVTNGVSALYKARRHG